MGIAVHPTTGLVFVADSYNNRIQVFNSDLTYAHSITLHGDKQFNSPYDVSLDSDGCVYVAEWGVITVLQSSLQQESTLQGLVLKDLLLVSCTTHPLSLLTIT